MDTPAHLGGHGDVVHIDLGILEYLKKHRHVKTMVDVGCGPGWMVDLAIRYGMTAFGIDGDPQVIRERVRQHDFTIGPYEIKETDLAWSVEFLEHVPEECLDNVFSVLGKCKYVFCTHNNMSDSNHRHVNVKSNEYWIEVFKRYGFEYDEAFTKKLKEASTMTREFVRDTGQFFERV